MGLIQFFSIPQNELTLQQFVDKVKKQHVEQYSSNLTSSSPVVYRTLQPEYVYEYAEYLYSVNVFKSKAVQHV